LSPKAKTPRAARSQARKRKGKRRVVIDTNVRVAGISGFREPMSPGRIQAPTCSAIGQRMTMLRPACLPSRLCDVLHQRLQQLRCLRCCSDCYRVERTSSRAGHSCCGPSPFHGARGSLLKKGLATRTLSEFGREPLLLFLKYQLNAGHPPATA